MFLQESLRKNAAAKAAAEADDEAEAEAAAEAAQAAAAATTAAAAAATEDKKPSPAEFAKANPIPNTPPKVRAIGVGAQICLANLCKRDKRCTALGRSVQWMRRWMLVHGGPLCCTSMTGSVNAFRSPRSWQSRSAARGSPCRPRRRGAVSAGWTHGRPARRLGASATQCR